MLPLKCKTLRSINRNWAQKFFTKFIYKITNRIALNLIDQINEVERRKTTKTKKTKTAIHVKYTHSILTSNGYTLILPLKVRLFFLNIGGKISIPPIFLSRGI